MYFTFQMYLLSDHLNYSRYHQKNNIAYIYFVLFYEKQIKEDDSSDDMSPASAIESSDSDSEVEMPSTKRSKTDNQAQAESAVS